MTVYHDPFRRGWYYRIGNSERGPFISVVAANRECKRELYYLRAIARANENRPMTLTDRRLERQLECSTY